MKRLLLVTRSTEIGWHRSMVRNQQCKSCTTAPTTTFMIFCTHMVSSHPLTCNLRKLAPCLVARDCARACAQTLAGIAPESMNGEDATCTVLAFTLETCLRRAIDMFRNP